MRGVVLSDGLFVRIGVKHTNDEKITRKFHGWGEMEIEGLRGTRVMLTVVDTGYSVEGVAICSPEDNFCKREGRRRAAMNLLNQLKWFTKEEKRKIFFNVCPEYEPKKA